MEFEPMLAEKGTIDVLSSNEHLFEPKLDGTRCIAVKKGRRVYIYNRLINDISYLYPLIKRELEEYDGDFIVDGELVCYNERGQPDYRLLMRREQALNKNDIDMRANAIPATYVIFDVLSINDKNLINEPIEERKKVLRQLIKETSHVERMIFTEQGNELWDLIKRNNMEGLVVKRKGSFYQSGKRSKDWLKIKSNKSVDTIIIGYTEGKGRAKDYFTSLILGLYKHSKLVKVGRVETGWDDESRKYIMKKLIPLKKKKEDKMVSVTPEIVCEVDFLELTKEKELRAPVFKRLRYKEASMCTWKQIEQ
ncbi:MAG: ATP-dependent DNA ligase [Candidatus Nanoarchaeia archaeon]|jgi:DNA ligase D-like protein (predicted ligase)